MSSQTFLDVIMVQRGQHAVWGAASLCQPTDAPQSEQLPSSAARQTKNEFRKIEAHFMAQASSVRMLGETGGLAWSVSP